MEELVKELRDEVRSLKEMVIEVAGDNAEYITSLENEIEELRYENRNLRNENFDLLLKRYMD